MTIRQTFQAAKGMQWLGQSVLRLDGSLEEIGGSMPSFSRVHLTYENALNEYLDLIIRDPVPDDERAVPVATVSKRYALIQHREAIHWLTEGFASQEWDPAKINATAWISDYGERMRTEITLPIDQLTLCEGETLGAYVLVWNSVDRTRAFEIAIQWRRLICKNGLTIWKDDRLRKVHHIDWMSATSPSDFLAERLPKSVEKTRGLDILLRTGLKMTDAIAWADEDIAGRWGKTRAARLIHILQTGSDCAVGRGRAESKASKLEKVQGKPVPGAPNPAGTIYDAYGMTILLDGEWRLNYTSDHGDLVNFLYEPLTLQKLIDIAVCEASVGTDVDARAIVSIPATPPFPATPVAPKGQRGRVEPRAGRRLAIGGEDA